MSATRSDLPSIQFDAPSPSDRYLSALEAWKAASQCQYDGLKASDWDAFEEALAYKNALLEAWNAADTDATEAWQASSMERRARCDALVREIQELDGAVRQVIERLMSELKNDLKRFEFERRVVRAYRKLPNQVSPSYHDKRY